MRLLLLQLPQYIQNIYIFIFASICPNHKLYSSKSKNMFFQIACIICPDRKMYLSKLLQSVVPRAPFPLPRTNESAAAPPIYIRRCTQHCTAIHYYALYCALQCTAVICSMIILQICAWMKHTFCNNIAQISTDSPSVELTM